MPNRLKPELRTMNILDEIVAHKRTEVAGLPQTKVTGASLRAVLDKRGRRDFIAALHTPRLGTIGLIAEVKKASPSAGVICPNFDAVKIAKEYEAAGASCLSVLTDEKYFQGSLNYLKQIRGAVNIPLLRKDFIVDERQIGEAIEWGADAILLIVACLSDADLKHFHDLATDAGLAALIEVHDEPELDRALAIDPKLVGVNNRNLKDLTIDLATTEKLAKKLFAKSPDALLVAESGLKVRADVERVQRAGAKAILVGESLMKDAANIRKNIAALIPQ
jgi:indole-3-glycerol phosphate synthase